MVQYGTAAEARKRAHNMGTNFYSDAEINEIMTRYSNGLHLTLGKTLAAVFTASDVEFSTAETYVINATACEMLASVEIQDDGKCEEKAQKALDELTGGGTNFAIITGHYEINDGLDENLYLQRDP